MKTYKKVTPVIIGVLLVAGLAVAGFEYSVKVDGPKSQGSMFGDWFGNSKDNLEKAQDELYYQAHKTFFAWVRGNARSNTMPKYLRDILKPYYKNSMSKVKVYVSSNLKKYENAGKDSGVPAYAISSCYDIYFPTSEVLDAMNNKTLSKGKTHWLLHELAHTEQCYNYDKNDAKHRETIAAKRWVTEAGIKLFQNPKGNIDEIHDAMPLEKEAEAKADKLTDEVYAKIKAAQ